MTVNTQNWKDKYRDLANEFEQHEKQSAGAQAQLSQLIGYMSMGLKGEGEEFDADLSALKKLLQQDYSSNLSKFKRVSQQIENHVQAREEQRNQDSKKIVEELQRWIKLLRTQIKLADTQNQLTEIERHSRSVEYKIYELPKVMAELISLQSQLENSPNKDNELFAKDFALDSETPNNKEQDTSILLQRNSIELLELIGGLHVPKEEISAAHRLVKMLEKGFELIHLPDIVHKVVRLVLKSTSTTSSDFENYLIELSSRLMEVQTFMEHNRQQQQEIGDNQRELDKQVRQDVKKIHLTVKNTHDITELKKAVSHQLSGLVNVMDDFKKKEEEREQKLQGQYENLIDKVEQMEAETLKVKAHMEEERVRARTDPLTGLPNRSAYDEYIIKEYERWQRYKTQFSVAVGDLDRFKQVNDNYGHLAGDKVLRLAAKVISKGIRATDFAGRYGGEEFVIILPSTSLKDAVLAMDKLRQVLATSPFNFHGKPVNITMSFGVTEIKHNDSLDAVFERADKALYQAKNTGRNKVCSM